MRGQRELVQCWLLSYTLQGEGVLAQLEEKEQQTFVRLKKEAGSDVQHYRRRPQFDIAGTVRGGDDLCTQCMEVEEKLQSGRASGSRLKSMRSFFGRRSGWRYRALVRKLSTNRGSDCLYPGAEG